MFTKNVWAPSIGERLQLRRQDDYDDHAVKAETINSRRVPREMSRTFWNAWWERRMRDNGKEDAVGCEITRKRTLGKGGGGGGGRINEGGGRIHDTPSMWKNRGGGGGGGG